MLPPMPPSPDAGPPRAPAQLRMLAAMGCVGVLACAGATACGSVDDDPRLRRDPGELRIQRSVPTPFAETVDPEISIDLCFNDQVDPRSLDEFDAIISSGTAFFDTNVEIQLFAYRPPGRRTGVATEDEPWCRGSVLSARPQTRLRGNATFRLRLEPTPRGWAGDRLDTDTKGWIDESEDTDGSGDQEQLRYTVEFRTGPVDDPDAPIARDPEIRLTDLFAPGEVFDPERGLCSCHLDPEDPANQRLDLRSPTRAFEDLVMNDRVFDTGFTMVSPGRPADSYLIQKLVHESDGGALWRVSGRPMPPSGPLPIPDRGRIAQWIAGGALP